MIKNILKIVDEFIDFLVLLHERDNIKEFNFKRKHKKIIHYLFDYQERTERIKLLEFLFNNSNTIFLRYSENPNLEQRFGDWLEYSDDFYMLDSQKEILFDDFLDWLYLGDWQLYFSEKNIDISSFDLKNNNDSIRKLNCIVDSYKDNIDWKIYLNTN